MGWGFTLWSEIIIILGMRAFLTSLLEVIEVLAIAVISVLVIKTFLIQPFLVSGDSMESSFSDGNYLLVDEVSYRFREPKRGEVIVFRYPENKDLYYIKRIIGLPGEEIEIGSNRVVIYDKAGSGEGVILDESYLDESTRTSGEIKVAFNEDEYFVMGDNRVYSFDSRSWGSLPKEDIMGLVRFNLWPLGEARAIENPIY